MRKLLERFIAGFLKSRASLVLTPFQYVLALLQSVNLSVRESSIKILFREQRGWMLVDYLKNEVLRTPSVLDAFHLAENHRKKMREIYSLSGFVEVDEGDRVIDVGAYLGSFSLAFQDRASEIIAVDPFSTIDECLELNTENCSNIDVIDKAVWETRSDLEMKLSVFPNENSIVDIDHLYLGETKKVEAITVGDIIEERGWKKLEFLKIEAEGAEPEAVKGALDSEIDIEKIVVDCSPERAGKSPTGEVVALLENSGYEVRIEEYEPWGAEFVYARLT